MNAIITPIEDENHVTIEIRKECRNECRINEIRLVEEQSHIGPSVIKYLRNDVNNNNEPIAFYSAFCKLQSVAALRFRPLIENVREPDYVFLACRSLAAQLSQFHIQFTHNALTPDHLFVEDDSHSEPYKVRIGSFGHVEFESDGIMKNTAHGKVKDMITLGRTLNEYKNYFERDPADPLPPPPQPALGQANNLDGQWAAALEAIQMLQETNVRVRQTDDEIKASADAEAWLLETINFLNQVPVNNELENGMRQLNCSLS